MILVASALVLPRCVHRGPEHRVDQDEGGGQGPSQDAGEPHDPGLGHEGHDQDHEEVEALAHHPEVGAHHEVVEQGVQGLASAQPELGPASDGAHLA